VARDARHPRARDDGARAGHPARAVGHRVRGRQHLPLLRAATIGGIGLAFAFLGSVVLDRPLARRFAADFAELPPEVLARPDVHRCFRRLSLLWGVYGILNAALGVWMLLALTPATYVMLRTPLSIVGTAAMVAVSTLWFRRVVADAEPRRRPGRAGLGPGRADGVAGTGVDPVTPRFSGACSAD
jgi:hypothetical protein